MLASTHDLPLRTNYFAEGAYLAHDLESGTIRNRAGSRMLVLSDDLLVALVNTLAAEMGDQASNVIAALGKQWGRNAAAEFAEEMELHFGKPLQDLPLALFTASLAESFRHHGWGGIEFMLDRFVQGLVVVDMRDPLLGSVVRPAKEPVELLTAAFLAGMFSQFAGVELDCVQTECRACGSNGSKFVLTIPERFAAARASIVTGKSHDSIVRELCCSQVN
jgi:predicted hydrocarbon binding protein